MDWTCLLYFKLSKIEVEMKYCRHRNAQILKLTFQPILRGILAEGILAAKYILHPIARS